MSTRPPAALITGASSGIGAAYAERLARRGHDLLLVARDEARLDALAKRLREETGVIIDVLPADLTDKGQLLTIEQRLHDDGRIGILVNNAGAAAAGGFAGQTPDAIEWLIDLNVTALARLATVAAQAFTARGGGAIINIGSVVGLAPEISFGVYGATKAFVLALSQALNAELGGQGLHVQAVLPAVTRTEIWRRSGRDVNQLPGVMEVGDLVDAALIGFDRKELVTIPPLPDLAQWEAFEAARQAMRPNFMNALPAERYRNP